MKGMVKKLKRVAVLLALLASSTLARAWYDPGVQRWINRDPLGDEAVVALSAMRQPEMFRYVLKTEGRGNLYTFNHNNPNAFVDKDGRQITVPLTPGVIIIGGIAISITVCEALPPCRAALERAVRDLAKELCKSRTIPKQNDETCILVKEEDGMCRYWCPKSFVEKAIPVPPGGCPDTKNKSTF